LAGWLSREENNWSLVSIAGTAVTNTEKLQLHSSVGAESKGMKEKWQRKMGTCRKEARAITVRTSKE